MSRMESVSHADAVRSGPFHRQQSTGSKRPYLEIRPLDHAQMFSRVSGGCFRLSRMESVSHADAVRRGHSTDRTRVPGQKVRISRSDRWIALKCFHEFSEAIFHGVAWNQYVTPMPSGRGHSTERTRVPGQKVRISRSDHWIALKFFSRVSGGCFRWSSVESGTTHRCRPVGPIPPKETEYRVKRSVS